jgi:hypothetical protein
MKPEGDAITQPAYQGRESSAAQDVKAAAERAAQQAREQSRH